MGINFIPAKMHKNHPALTQEQQIRLHHTVHNTHFPAGFILKTYGEKYIAEKEFSQVKPHLDSFFSRSERGTRARLHLSILGYTKAAILAARCSIPYVWVMKTIFGIREVVYSNGSHSHVESTKDQRDLLEKVKIKLY